MNHTVSLKRYPDTNREAFPRYTLSVEVRGMFLELARPFSFVFCILSLYALFYAAFLNPGSDLDEKVYDSLMMLLVAAAVSLVSGLIFRETPSNTRCGSQRLSATLPVRMFCWAALTMLVLFVVVWYLETGVFYRDVRIGV